MSGWVSGTMVIGISSNSRVSRRIKNARSRTRSPSMTAIGNTAEGLFQPGSVTIRRAVARS